MVALRSTLLLVLALAASGTTGEDTTSRLAGKRWSAISLLKSEEKSEHGSVNVRPGESLPQPTGRASENNTVASIPGEDVTSVVPQKVSGKSRHPGYITRGPSAFLCPAECHCELQQHGNLSVTCTGGPVYDVIRQLPEETTILKYIFNESFNEANVTFSHLSRLTSLELTNEDLTRYEDSYVITRGDIFQGLGELRQLRIHLNLNYINETALTPLTALTTLDLSHTRSLDKINVRQLLNAIQRFIPSLQHLSVRNFQFPSQGHGMAIIDIREDILKHLDGVSLIELDVSDNGVTVFHPGLIEFLPDLQVLTSLGEEGRDDGPWWLCTLLDYFFHPRLRSVSVGATTGSRSNDRRKRDTVWSIWDVFSARKNHCYRTQSWEPFQNMSSYHPVCGLVACMCSNYTNIPCEYVPKVQDLIDFRQPECGYLYMPLPPMLEHVELINERSALGSFSTAHGPRTVCLNKPSGIQYFGGWYTISRTSSAFYFPIVRGIDKLWYANIQGNHAVLQLSKMMRKIPNLSHALLGGNIIDIDVNDTTVFVNNTKLRSLDFAECGLSDLALIAPSLESLGRLEFLNVSGNAFHRFNLNISKLINLRLLNISQNQLTSLPNQVTSDLEGLAEHHNVTVDLSGNPLACGCSSLGFFTWLKSTRVELSDRSSMLCIHPTLGQVAVSAVSVQDLTAYCHPSHWRLIVYTVLSTTSFLAIVLSIVVVYRKRWTIRFYIHAARQSWKRRTRNRDDAAEPIFPYDAFVVYSSEDRRWVHDVLLKTLENEHQLRLCIHFRDFIPGRNIEDTIVESIEKSRKTILVLSPNFVKSEWCRFEFRMARQKIVEGLDVLVPLILEELPTYGLCKTLTRLLQRNTYITWTDDELGQRLFWDQLVTAIRDKLDEDPEP